MDYEEEVYQNTEEIIIYKKRVLGFVLIDTPNVCFDLHVVDSSYLYHDNKANISITMDYINDEDGETVKGFTPSSCVMYAVYCNLQEKYGNDYLLGYEVEGEEPVDWNKVMSERKLKIIKNKN